MIRDQLSQLVPIWVVKKKQKNLHAYMSNLTKKRTDAFLGVSGNWLTESVKYAIHRK